MKLAGQFEVTRADNFLLSNFRAGLLKYLQVAIVGLPRLTLAYEKKSAKLAESSLPKEPDPTPAPTRPDQIDKPKRAVYTLCKKLGHLEKDCWLNPESDFAKRRAAATPAIPVAVATPVQLTARSRSQPLRDTTRRRIFLCSLCKLLDHPTHLCPMLMDPRVVKFLN